MTTKNLLKHKPKSFPLVKTLLSTKKKTFLQKKMPNIQKDIKNNIKVIQLQKSELIKFPKMKWMIPYPRILIILLRRSNSEAPGNNGSPRNNSATMHPNDHMSIAVEYLYPRLRSSSIFASQRFCLISRSSHKQREKEKSQDKGFNSSKGRKWAHQELVFFRYWLESCCSIMDRTTISQQAPFHCLCVCVCWGRGSLYRFVGY